MQIQRSDLFIGMQPRICCDTFCFFSFSNMPHSTPRSKSERILFLSNRRAIGKQVCIQSLKEVQFLFPGTTYGIAKYWRKKVTDNTLHRGKHGGKR